MKSENEWIEDLYNVRLEPDKLLIMIENRRAMLNQNTDTESTVSKESYELAKLIIGMGIIEKSGDVSRMIGFTEASKKASIFISSFAERYSRIAKIEQLEFLNTEIVKKIRYEIKNSVSYYVLCEVELLIANMLVDLRK